MQSDIPGDNTLHQSNKRRRTSGRSEVTEPPEASNALSTGRRSLMTSSPQPQAGSSREMSSPDGTGSIKYTRTGRVSKATKGQRVHQCDECGKIYTRAEHLRRHQQNHKPGAFPCDVPGCGRSFYREDLLTRHKARHDDPLDQLVSPQGSPGSQGSGPTAPFSGHAIPFRGPVTQDLTIHDANPQPTNAPPAATRTEEQQGGHSSTSKRHLNSRELQRHGLSEVPVDTNGAWSSFFSFGSQQWEPSPPYSPTGYDSPNVNGPAIPYFQPHVEQARHDSHASFYGFHPPHTSRSPVSAGSSTIQLPQWGTNAHNTPYASLNTSSGSEGSYGDNLGYYNSHTAAQQAYPGAYSATMWTPEDRDFMEQDELAMNLTVSRSSSSDLSFDEGAYSSEEKYLNAYWIWVHPFYPVIHRPSFDLQHTSPLLKAAVLALGAQACDDVADKRSARLIHERSVKVLQKRTLNEWHTYRSCDSQAIVLIEIYSIFKSRRPPLQFSKTFEEVYKQLANDSSVTESGGLNAGVMPGAMMDSIVDDFTGLLTLDGQIKKRLLMVCYLLDIQHATLFGRQKTTCYSGTGLDLPFPEHRNVWDAAHQPSNTTSPSKVWEAIDGGDANGSSNYGYDIFQSSLLMAALSDQEEVLDLPGPPNPSQSDRSRMAFHTFQLCKATPVRDLLAVAGESWVMSEKISTAKEFTESQQRCAQWARATNHDREPMQRAMWHAMEILKIHHGNPKTGLLYQEWSIYMASIVLWARAFTSSSVPQRMPRLSVPQPVEPRLSSQEVERAASAVFRSPSSGEAISSEQAKHVLLWTKAKIEKVDVPHNCGLTNGALDVLGKLITRGNEDGWFGS